MADISVQPNQFTITVSGDELNLSPEGGSAARVSVCAVIYPKGLTLGQGPVVLDSSVATGNMGVLSVTKQNGFQNYIMPSANTGQNVETLNISNKLNVDSVFIQQDQSTFEPCNLDYNGDQSITRRDIDRIYANIPFYNSDYDINNDGIVDEEDYFLAQEFVGYLCPPRPTGGDDTDVLPPTSVFSINAQDFANGSNGDWKTGWVEDWNVYQYNQEPMSNMNLWRNNFISTTGSSFRDYIQYCFDNGHIDKIEEYYDPELPVGSPFIDRNTFEEPVFDFNSFRQYYRPNVPGNFNVGAPELHLDHTYTALDRPIDNEFSVSFWWYWDSSVLPEGYTWQDVYTNGYGDQASGPVEAWHGTANYISQNFIDETAPPISPGRTGSVTLWNISGLVKGYPSNEVMDLQIDESSSYINTEFPDRIATRVMMRYDHGYSRLWFTGAVSGANTTATSFDQATLGQIAIPREVYWEPDKWHNITVTKKRDEIAVGYLDGEVIGYNQGLFVPSSPIGYYHQLRLGPMMTASGEYVYRYPEDTDFLGTPTYDVFVGGPANYTANYNRGPGHWYPPGNTYDQAGQAQIYGQGSGNFIGKTNGFKVWDKALTAEQVRHVYDTGIARGVPV